MARRLVEKAYASPIIVSMPRIPVKRCIRCTLPYGRYRECPAPGVTECSMIAFAPGRSSNSKPHVRLPGMPAQLPAKVLCSLASEKRVPQQEKHRQNPDQRADLAMPPGAQLDERVREQPEAESRGDAERQRRSHHGHESGEAVGQIV